VSELPVNWVRTPLEAIGQWGSGGTPKRTNPEYYDGGKIPWLIIGDLNDDVVKHSATHITEVGLANSSAKLLPTETLLIAMYGSIGKLGITGIKCATNQAIAFCKPDNDVTTLRYLFYALMNAKSGLIAQGQGGAQQNISQGILKAHEVPLAPLNEQKRIADKLDAVLARVDACRDRLDRIPGILKRFRQSVLTAATAGKLTEDWRVDNAISGEWQKVKLGEVARELSYGTSAKSSKSGSVPVLRMGNIQDGRLDWSSLVYTSDAKEITKYQLAKGDVLFNRTNSPELVGKAAVFKGEREAIYAGYLIRVRCSSKLIPDYLNYCLGSPLGRDYCWQVKSDGVSQSNINAKKLAAFGFLLPSVEEQTEIVRRAESLFAFVDRLEACYTAALAQVEKLTPATLAKAFRGELVPQDPNDEPARKLLERIHANSTPESSKSRVLKLKAKELAS